MDQLVSQIEQVVTEPVAIYVNPTYLPESIADRYDELWTDERIDRIVITSYSIHYTKLYDFQQ